MSEAHHATLRVATYNVHGCVGIDGKRSESRIAEVIASSSADIVGLQELDANRKRSGAVDQAAAIAAQLGWQHVFHPAMRNGDEQYGNAIVSRYPLVLKRAIELPGEGSWYCRETRIAIWCEAETELGAVQIINTHLGLNRAERFAQAQLLASAEYIGSVAGEPLVLLGDFNTLPRSRTHRALTSALRDARELVASAGPCRTFPTRFPSVAVDHILVNAALHPTNLSVHRSALARLASDHYPLVADLALDLR